MKNLVLGYFHAPPKKRSEVLKLIGNVLNFSIDELQTVSIWITWTHQDLILVYKLPITASILRQPVPECSMFQTPANNKKYLSFGWTSDIFIYVPITQFRFFFWGIKGDIVLDKDVTSKWNVSQNALYFHKLLYASNQTF